VRPSDYGFKSIDDFLTYVRDIRAPTVGARLVCSCTRSGKHSRMGYQPHCQQDCNMEAWDERVGAQFVTVHFHGTTDLSYQTQGWSRGYLGNKTVQHISWFLWLDSTSDSNYGGIESGQFISGQLTLGMSNDRFVWMVKLWPFLFGGTTPQFGLSVFDWMHYFCVVIWCHAQLWPFSPHLVLGPIILALLVGFVRRYCNVLATVTPSATVSETLRIVAAEEQPTEYADDAAAKRAGLATPLSTALRRDSKTVCLAIVVLTALFMLGTRILYDELAPERRIPQVYLNAEP